MTIPGVVTGYWKKDAVTATQLTTDTDAFLTDFNGARTALPQAATSGHGVFVVTGSGNPIDVPVGSWVVTNQSGEIEVYNDADFHSRFSS